MDSVLYAKTGRADFRPVLSVDPNHPAHDDLVAIKRQELIGAALRSGAMIPEFKLDRGKAATKKQEG